MKPSKFCHYSSHIPLIIAAIKKTDGDVLEMGSGFFSTPVIHWLCEPRKRKLLTLENDIYWYYQAESFSTSWHEIRLVKDWDLEPIDKEWDVVFIDHAPSERRAADVARLANYAKLIIVHDANGRHDKKYHLDKVWPLFKYMYSYTAFPQTNIVSNFMPLDWIDSCL